MTVQVTRESVCCILLVLQAVAFFTSKIDKLEQKPLSSQAVMELVVQSSKAWNSSRLKVCDHLGCADHFHKSLQRLAVPFVMCPTALETDVVKGAGRGRGGQGG